LYLEILPRSFTPGNTIALQVGEGKLGDLWMIAVTELDGVPTFIPVLRGTMRISGGWETTVDTTGLPPGGTMGVTAYAIVNGKLRVSAVEHLDY
ncbi:MAG: hypothetical protein JNL90_10810, partial [Planctomycetes bacterium]|nr:hypothetical protein [Planctomycetota bacterium]